MSESALHAKVDALTRAQEHAREDLAQVARNQSDYFDAMRASQDAVGRSILDVHNGLARMEERLKALTDSVTDRLDDHSEDLRDKAAMLAILQSSEARREERARIAVFATKVAAAAVGVAATLVGIAQALGQL